MLTICLDWGTTRFRAFLLHSSGEVIETLETNDGIANINGDFETVLLKNCKAWFNTHAIKHIIASGMITSKNGWHETPYVETPATLERLKQAAHRFTLKNGIDVKLLTGVKDINALPFPDVMRGEETQIMGLNLDNGFVITPGTHSKWVEVKNGSINRFTTYATGEFYNVMLNKSFIGGFAKEGAFNESAFLKGCESVLNTPLNALSSLIFSVRTGYLAGVLDEEKSADYLSGLLIAKEFQEGLLNFKTQEAWLIASSELASRYKLVAKAFNIELFEAQGNLALKGMMRLNK